MTLKNITAASVSARIRKLGYQTRNDPQRPGVRVRQHDKQEVSVNVDISDLPDDRTVDVQRAKEIAADLEENGYTAEFSSTAPYSFIVTKKDDPK